MERGGLWNSFLMVASGRALTALYLRRRPSLLHALSFAPRRGDGALDPIALARLYASIPSSDFSRELLQGSEDRLSLVPVPYCGWSDLGTPARLAACVHLVRPQAVPPSMRYPLAPVVLAEVFATPIGHATPVPPSPQ